MAFSISRLFQSKTTVKDGLTQLQREAIADLLHYCMFADNHIALAETKTIADVVGTFAWDPNIAFESFEARSVAEARAAKEDAPQRKAFLDSIKLRLNTPTSRSLALDVCKQLFNVDGVSPDESLLLTRLSRLLA
ncbi:MAG TPA: hypothetical protein VHO24_20610 [Opitutaceae bacterium]|nr:hypothetical protein [Opitutaceae bacterium]